jgi:anti-anti-sigma factor
MQEDVVRGLEPSAGGDLVTPVAGAAPTLTLVPRLEPAEDNRWEHLSHGAIAIMCTGSLVRVRGEVDRSNARLLREALYVVARAGDDVTVDLAGLTFIDLGGIRALVDSAALLAPDRRLTLVSPPRLLRRILDTAGIVAPGTFLYRPA